jgi:hypothetical protein
MLVSALTIRRMDDLWSVAVPTWLTGMGTLGLAGLTFALIRREGSDRERLQAIEEERIDRERRAQASGIAAWYSDDFDRAVTDDGETARFSRILLANTSPGPVFDAAVSLVFIQGAGPRTGEEISARPRTTGGSSFRVFNVVPPGVWQVLFPCDWHGMHTMAGAEVGFIDTAGRSWIRRASGGLEEMLEPPTSYYNLGQPHGYWLLEPFSAA